MAVEIRKPLKKLLPYLLKAKEDNLNEADTLQRVLKVFEEVLGYDLMTELTREQQVKDKFVDIAVRLDDSVRLLVEVKSAATTLRDRHIEQAERYAAQANLRWVLLTNGVEWNLYHLSFEEGVESERVFAVNLASDALDSAAEQLGLLHRQSVRDGKHEEHWQQKAALSPESVARVLFQEDVLRILRRSIRKREGLLVDVEDLATALHAMLSTEARERIGPMRIHRTRKAVRVRNEADTKPLALAAEAGGEKPPPGEGTLTA